jgi:hypothetical protein
VLWHSKRQWMRSLCITRRRRPTDAITAGMTIRRAPLDVTERGHHGVQFHAQRGKHWRSKALEPLLRLMQSLCQFLCRSYHRHPSPWSLLKPVRFLWYHFMISECICRVSVGIEYICRSKPENRLGRTMPIPRYIEVFEETGDNSREQAATRIS